MVLMVGLNMTLIIGIKTLIIIINSRIATILIGQTKFPEGRKLIYFREVKHMSIEELIEIIEIGHEIEFRLFENQYFLQPCYSYNKNLSTDTDPWFVIYDCKDSKNVIELFRGTCQDIINYNFTQGVCFKDHMDVFVFDAIF